MVDTGGNMDYRKMAIDLFQCMKIMRQGPAKRINEMSQGEMAMLGFLSFEKEETTPTELSEQFNLSTARVANTLNSLEKKGYVQRIHDLNDRRKVIVRATELGLKISIDRYEEALVSAEQLLQSLGEKDASEYIRIMKRINEVIVKKDSKI